MSKKLFDYLCTGMTTDMIKGNENSNSKTINIPKAQFNGNTDYKLDYDIFNNYTDGKYEEEYNGLSNDKYYQDNDVISSTSTGLYKTNTLSIR